MQASGTNPPVAEGRGVPEQTSLPSWACWWRPWRWVCPAGQTARRRWTMRWVQDQAHRPRSGRKPAGPAGSADLGPGAAWWHRRNKTWSTSRFLRFSSSVHHCIYQKQTPFQVLVDDYMADISIYRNLRRRHDNPTRTESTMVMSRLHTAMEINPVRSSFLLPARSIKKNLEKKERQQLSGDSVHIYSVQETKISRNIVIQACDSRFGAVLPDDSWHFVVAVWLLNSQHVIFSNTRITSWIVTALIFYLLPPMWRSRWRPPRPASDIWPLQTWPGTFWWNNWWSGGEEEMFIVAR